MAVQSVHIRNMRVLEDVRLTFTPGFNVLVGDNGSGKSTVLDSISAAFQVGVVARSDVREGADHFEVTCTLYDGSTYQVHSGGRSLTHKGTSTPVVVVIDPIKVDGHPGSSLGERWTRTILQTIRENLLSSSDSASAVVLIDGLEMGLHPTSQRNLLHTLLHTFPQCQFIATTHSPVIISELRREQVQILTPEGVEHPSYCYGQEASTVLTSVQGALCRPVAVQDALDHLASLAQPETLQEAREALLELASKMEEGENDPELVRVAAHLHFLEC